MNIIQHSRLGPVNLWKLGSSRIGRPKLFVYCFLVDGLLIDTGQPLIKKELCSALNNLSIHKIVLTHHHEDHSGNVEAIKQLKGINAYSSEKCCQLMLRPMRVEPARFMTWGQHTVAYLNSLDDESHIETDNYKFRIIHTPGHAIDQISLYEEKEGWLFPGDLFVNDYIRIFMRDEQIGQQISSLKELLRLDFDILFCNHQPIFTGGKDRLKNKLHFLEDFYGSVKKEYEKGLSEKEIMKTLGIKESRIAKIYSLGQLSALNMVRSVVRDVRSPS